MVHLTVNQNGLVLVSTTPEIPDRWAHVLGTAKAGEALGP